MNCVDYKTTLFLRRQIINPMYGYHGRERSPEPGARGGEHGEVCADLHRRLATLIDLVSSSGNITCLE